MKPSVPKTFDMKVRNLNAFGANPIKAKKLPSSCRRLVVSRCAKPILAGSITVLFSMGGNIRAADQTWDGDSGTDWNTATNWSNNSTPGGSTATINSSVSGKIATLNGTPGFSVTDINIGFGSGTNGQVDVTSGTLSTGNGNWSTIGYQGGSGTLNIANTSASGGTLTGMGLGSGSYAVPNARLYLGGRDGNSTGTAFLNINTSGSVSAGSIYVGSKGATGTIKLDAGTLSSAGNLEIGTNSGSGSAGTGTLNMSGGTVNVTGETWLGEGSGSVGNMNMSAGTVNATSWFVVGRDGGTGTLTMSGGTFNKTNNGTNFVIADTGSTGTVNLNGGTLNTAFVGSNGSGTLNFGGGTLKATVANSAFIQSNVAVKINAAGGTIDSNGFNIGITASIVTGVPATVQTLTKAGNGVFTLGGSSDNISLGANVTGGTLLLAKASTSGVHAVGGDLTIVTGATGQLGGSGGDQIYFGASVTANGTFDMAGFSEGINGLSGNGTVRSTGVATTLTVGQNGGSSIFTGVVTNVSGNIVNITKEGGGTITLGGTGDNVGAGATVNAGTLILGKTTNASSHAVGTFLSINGGTAQLGTGGNGDQIYQDAAVTLGTAGTFDMNGQNETFQTLAVQGAGALKNTAAGTSSVLTVQNGNGTGGTSFSADSTVDVASTSSLDLKFNNTVTGNAHVITKSGAGALVLSGTADNAGLTMAVSAGSLVLAKTSTNTVHAAGATNATELTVSGTGAAQLGGTGGDQLYDLGDVVVTSGSFDLNDRSETIRNLSLAGTGISGAGALVNSGTGSSTLTATGGIALTANASIGITVGSGVIQMVNPISGGFTLTKVGDGTLKLSGASTYSGQTTVSAGTLSVNNTTGSGTGSGTVSVASTGTLGGTGTIGGATTISGNHTPGVGIGNQSFNSSLSYQSGSIFNWEIDVTGANTSSFDSVAANSLGGSAAIFKVLLDSGDNYSATFWQQARTWSAFAVTTGSWNLSSIFTGFQYGNSTPDAVTQGSFSFTPDGHSLQWNPVPEPTNSLLAGILLGAGVLRRNRGKRRG